MIRWSLVLLVACDPADTDPSGSGSAAAADERCGRFAAVRAGRTWTWDYDDAGTTGTWSTTVVDFDGEAGAMHTLAAYGADSYVMSSVTKTSFRCDRGVIIERADSEWSGISAGTAFEGTSTTTYTAGGPQLPLTLTAGATWTVRYAGETVSDPGGASRFDYATDYEVIGQEYVSVPAGPYDAWRIDSETDTGVASTMWTVTDVGTVKTTGTALVSVED